MVIELESGRYLHTAYAISDVAEELLPDEWSTTERADGMDYVGTYTDDSPTDSTDATDYEWEEIYDLDVDDTDEDDEMPVAEEQSQIASVEERLNILEQDSENMNEAIDNLNTNVEGASTISSDAMDIAQATGQHFWTDTDGVHISNEEGVAEGERNSLWNSLGMLFRKGANNIIAILTGGASGTGEKGLAIYDGDGNSDDNIVASFTSRIVRMGKETSSHVDINTDGVTIRESDDVFPYTRLRSSQLVMIEIPETHGLSITPDEIAFPYDVTSGKSYITSRQFRLGLSTSITGSASILGRLGDAESDDILALVWSDNIQDRNKYYIRLKNNGNVNINGQYQHEGNPIFRVVTGITGTLHSAIASGGRGDVVASYTLPSGYNRVLGVRAIDSNHQTALVLTSFDVSGDGSYGATVSLTARFRNVTSSSVASGTTATWEICIGIY